ncbi:MAG: sporulation initiation factor Spo0A C-terminal domain-containing protein [Clostridia bacterium]|nr:sporulation initiation factor Spo0A C-terminal domain-containing protein [Clostridia bacterium]
MIKAILIKETGKAEVFKDALKYAGFDFEFAFADSLAEALPKMKDTIELVIISGDYGIGALSELLASAKWDKMRICAFKVQSGNDALTFYACYKGQLFHVFDSSSFDKPLTAQKFVSLLKSGVKAEAMRTVRNFLIKIGIYSNLIGHDYILYAVSLAIEDPKILVALTTELYPKVGERFGVKPQNVERNMRSAIESSCNKGKFFETANSLGGNFKSYEKPATGEFIAFLVDVIYSA